MKKKILAILLVLALPFTLAACGSSESAEEVTEEEITAEEATTEEEAAPAADVACPSVNGKLQVVGSNLCDEGGNPVQLKGISTHGIAWYPEYINEECVAELKSWGANVLRLAMYTAEDGGYCTGGDKETLKDLVRSGVEYATAADMYVIVDWHILSEGTPLEYEAEAESFFSEMSAEFAKNNNVIYEICNEPNTASWAEIKSYAEDIIPIIRAQDSDAVIVVGTPTWSQDVDAAAADPIEGYENIMYTLHFYAATHKDDLCNKMVAATEAGLPIFVTEYGICDASGNGSIDTSSANEWVSVMDEYGISYVAWNLSNKDESSAIIDSSVQKTSGFTYEDLSEEGKWVYDMLGGKTSEETASGSENESSSKAAYTTSSGLAVDMQLRESWQGDDGTYYLYDLTVKNDTKNDMSEWSFEISFEGDARYSDGWNAEYSLKKNKLTVKNADYNGALAAGESATDIGFIIIDATSPEIK